MCECPCICGYTISAAREMLSVCLSVCLSACGQKCRQVSLPDKTTPRPNQLEYLPSLVFVFTSHLRTLSPFRSPSPHTASCIPVSPSPFSAPFFPPLQTSTLAPQTDLSARTTAASLCAGCVTGIMTAGMTRMSPTPPVQVDKDSFILGRFGGFFLFMT